MFLSSRLLIMYYNKILLLLLSSPIRVSGFKSKFVGWSMVMEEFIVIVLLKKIIYYYYNISSYHLKYAIVIF